MFTGKLYLITCIVTGVQYVGQTTQSVRARWGQHLHDAGRGRKYHLHNAIRKYGPAAFTVQEFVNIHPEDGASLSQWERFLIAGLRQCGELYNLTGGGEGSYNPCVETRKRMRAAQLGKKRSPEHVANAAAALRGSKRTPEQCKHISDSLKGKPRTEKALASYKRRSEATRGIKVQQHRALRVKDISGKVFSRLTAHWPVGSTKKRGVKWLCSCVCGDLCYNTVDNLERGGSLSCGCYNKEQNLFRKGFTPWNAGKTHCKRGHERTPDNVNAKGMCRICSRMLMRIAQQKYRARLRAGRPNPLEAKFPLPKAPAGEGEDEGVISFARKAAERAMAPKPAAQDILPEWSGDWRDGVVGGEEKPQ